jgi:hypothetical protein
MASMQRSEVIKVLGLGRHGRKMSAADPDPVTGGPMQRNAVSSFST